MKIDNMDAEQSKRLPIVIEGHTFKPDSEGLWSLNEIHRGLALPESKAPSEWSNSVSAELTASGNFRKVDKVGSFADELGTIAYAMWVSTAFYLMVAHAFVVMRNDAILSARMALLAAAEADTKLSKAIPKADLIDARLTSSEIPWGQACKLVGISKPQLAKEYLVHIKRFVASEHPTECRKVLKPSTQGYKEGFFKSCSLGFGNDEGFRVTAKGLAWLQEKAQEINAAIAAEKARRNATKRRQTAKRLRSGGLTQ